MKKYITAIALSLAPAAVFANSQSLSEASAVIGFAYRAVDAAQLPNSQSLLTCLTAQMSAARDDNAWKQNVATACNQLHKLNFTLNNLVCVSNSYEVGAYQCTATLSTGVNVAVTGPKAQALWTSLVDMGSSGDAATGTYFMGASKIAVTIDFDGQVSGAEGAVAMTYDDAYNEHPSN